eukprot:gene15881-22374_t
MRNAVSSGKEPIRERPIRERQSTVPRLLIDDADLVWVRSETYVAQTDPRLSADVLILLPVKID